MRRAHCLCWNFCETDDKTKTPVFVGARYKHVSKQILGLRSRPYIPETLPCNKRVYDPVAARRPLETDARFCNLPCPSNRLRLTGRHGRCTNGGPAICMHAGWL